ncbi:hypothetical protein EVAR_53971_1 [Eumeta japonica]|uniref:Uncharacterized protein n=1 Tax=Eumeta variegata TaxID=151549 RepID=A0A4C1XZH9_EUMVA|nr:hypothetical protein EVAR_53971_1 [Eumeta japonica]
MSAADILPVGSSLRSVAFGPFQWIPLSTLRNYVCSVPVSRVPGVALRACKSMRNTAQYPPCVDNQTTCVRPEYSLQLTMPSARLAFTRFLCLGCTPARLRFRYPIAF